MIRFGGNKVVLILAKVLKDGEGGICGRQERERTNFQQAGVDSNLWRERGSGNFFCYREGRGGSSRAIGRIEAAVVVIMIGRIEAAVVGARWHGLSG